MVGQVVVVVEWELVVAFLVSRQFVLVTEAQFSHVCVSERRLQMAFLAEAVKVFSTRSHRLLRVIGPKIGSAGSGVWTELGFGIDLLDTGGWRIFCDPICSWRGAPSRCWRALKKQIFFFFCFYSPFFFLFRIKSLFKKEQRKKRLLKIDVCFVRRKKKNNSDCF